MKTQNRTLAIAFSLFLIISLNNVTAQSIDAENMSNLMNSKQNNGVEMSEDGKVKVQVNIEMIEKYYDYLSNMDNDQVSWEEILHTYNYDPEGFNMFWKKYKKSEEPVIIDHEFKENLAKAKEANGTEYLADGSVKIKVNTEIIESFYNAYENHIYISWREVFISYRTDKENLLAQWNTFKNSEEGNLYLAEKK